MPPIRAQPRLLIVFFPFHQAILDFSQDLDVGLFDRVVNAFFMGSGQEVRPLLINPDDHRPGFDQVT